MVKFDKFKYKNEFSNKNKILRLIWDLVWLVAFRPTPRWMLNSWRIFLLRVFGANIGKGSRVLPTCKIWAPWNLEIGESTVLGDHVDCYSMDKIKIGSYVSISQRSFICSGSHDITSIQLPLITKPILIHDYAWICSDAFIAPGCEIGEGAVVAARTVCIKNVPAWKVVAGNPSRVIKNRVVVEADSKNKRKL